MVDTTPPDTQMPKRYVRRSTGRSRRGKYIAGRSSRSTKFSKRRRAPCLLRKYKSKKKQYKVATKVCKATLPYRIVLDNNDTTTSASILPKSGWVSVTYDTSTGARKRLFHKARETTRLANVVNKKMNANIQFASPEQEARYRPPIAAAVAVRQEVAANLDAVKRQRLDI